MTEVERLRAALEPSAETKAAYIGEFSFEIPDGFDDNGEVLARRVDVPWTVIKEIMTAIRVQAEPPQSPPASPLPSQEPAPASGQAGGEYTLPDLLTFMRGKGSHMWNCYANAIEAALQRAKDAGREEAMQAIRDCAALDENGFICMKSDAFKAIRARIGEP